MNYLTYLLICCECLQSLCLCVIRGKFLGNSHARNFPASLWKRGDQSSAKQSWKKFVFTRLMALFGKTVTW